MWSWTVGSPTAATNELQVIARNSDQPNSRWYSGSGIYRPVVLWTAERERYIPLNGVRVRTLDYKTAKIEVTVKTSQPGPVNVEILDGEEVVCSATGESNGAAVLAITVPGGKLWSCDQPNLYQGNTA